MKKFGIDISEWQQGFDLDKALAEGVEFVILRGADHLYKDKCFEDFYAQCKARNIPVGVYHYSRATTPEQARQEAQFLIANVLKSKQFEYPVYMDVEDKTQQAVGKAALTDAVTAFCEEIKSAGYLPGVYASLSFLNSYLDDSRLGSYEKWIAQWYKYCQYGGELGLWQFGGETNVIRTNQVAGVVCDQNYAMFDYPQIVKSRSLNGYGKQEVKETETAETKKGDFTVEMRVLRNGSAGKDVRALQILLIGNGFDCGPWGADGNFGGATQTAVLNYQKKNGLLSDGMAGPETMTHLLGASA